MIRALQCQIFSVHAVFFLSWKIKYTQNRVSEVERGCNQEKLTNNNTDEQTIQKAEHNIIIFAPPRQH